MSLRTIKITSNGVDRSNEVDQALILNQLSVFSRKMDRGLIRGSLVSIKSVEVEDEENDCILHHFTVMIASSDLSLYLEVIGNHDGIAPICTSVMALIRKMEVINTVETPLMTEIIARS